MKNPSAVPWCVALLAGLVLPWTCTAQGLDHSRANPGDRGQNAQIKIVGSVFDASGRAIAGAVVRFRDSLHPGQAVETRTDDAGEFVQAGLEEGVYEVEVALLGYRTEHRTLVARSSSNRVDFTLQLINSDAAMMKPTTPADEFRKHLTDARAALLASDLAKVRSELASAASMGAWDAEYQTLAGQVAHLAGDCALAEKHLSRAKAISKGALRAEGALALGECWLRNGKTVEASALWADMARREPAAWSARVQAATSLVAVGEKAGALKVLLLDGATMDATAPPAAWRMALDLASSLGEGELAARLSAQGAQFGTSAGAR